MTTHSNRDIHEWTSSASLTSRPYTSLVARTPNPPPLTPRRRAELSPQEPPDFGNGILYKVMLDEQRQLKADDYCFSDEIDPI